MQSASFILLVILLFSFSLYNFIFISNFTIYNIIVYLPLFYFIDYFIILIKEYLIFTYNNFLDYYSFFLVIILIFTLYIIFIYLDILFTRHQIFKIESKNTSLPQSSPSFPSGSPRPPKKNWKEKLKEHLSNYKEVYIGAGITLSLIILYYYYGNGDVPPGTPSVEVGSNNIGPIGPEGNNNIGPIGPEVNNIGHNNLLLLGTRNIDTILDNDNMLLWSKYFFVFGIVTKFHMYHPLLVYLTNSQNSTISMNLIPFIINNNIIDFSLLSINKYYGICTHIGFMESNLNLLKQLTIFDNFVKQFQVEAKLKNLIPMDSYIKYNSFINYYNIILKVLNQNNLNVNIFHNFYLTQVLGMPSELQEFCDQISNLIDFRLSQYLLGVQENRFEFNEYLMQRIILKVLVEEYPGCKSMEPQHRLILTFKLLKVYSNNLNYYYNSQFNIVNNQLHFKQFYNLYLFLLNNLKIQSCSIIHFYTFLISYNCIESIESNSIISD